MVTADEGLLQMMKLCSLTPAAGVAELARTGLRGEPIFPKKNEYIDSALQGDVFVQIFLALSTLRACSRDTSCEEIC